MKFPFSDRPIISINFSRLVFEKDTQRIGTADTAQGPGDSLQRIAFIIVIEKMGHHLGVCLRQKDKAFFLEILLQLLIVLDDAVMDHNDPFVFGTMGVSVCH